MTMSIKSHIVLGEVVKSYRKAITVALRGRQPSDPGCAALIRIRGEIEDFSSAMDEEICKLVPVHLDPSDDVLKTYYGPHLDLEAQARLKALEPTNVDAVATPVVGGETMMVRDLPIAEIVAATLPQRATIFKVLISVVDATATPSAPAGEAWRAAREKAAAALRNRYEELEEEQQIVVGLDIQENARGQVLLALRRLRASCLQFDGVLYQEDVTADVARKILGVVVIQEFELLVAWRALAATPGDR
jgi:hypothetical protein